MTEEIFIRTPRLILRRPCLDDLHSIHSAKVEAWGELQKWMSWASDDEYSLEATERYIQQSPSSNCLPLIGVHADSGDFVVATGIDLVGTDIYRTGYWVAPKYMGQGYATESCNALIRFCFAKLDPIALYVDHYEGNFKSESVIRKLGFMPIRVVPKAHKSHASGEMLDVHEYARTDDDDLPPLEVIWS